MKNLFFISTMILLFACSNNESASEDYYYASIEEEYDNSYDQPVSQVANGVYGGTASSNVSDIESYDKKDTDYDGSSSEDEYNSNTAIERMLIKNGYINFESKDVTKTRLHINQLIDTYQGYISSENQYNYGSQLEEVLTIRMPSDNFDLFINGLSENVSHFDSKTINVQDVTEEYVDVQSRLTAKYEIEKTYIELLKKTQSVSEILNVERELGYIREEIESMEGRLRYLKSQASYSTLTLTYYEYAESIPSSGFFADLWYNIRQGGRDIKYAILDIAAAWPALIFMGVLIFFGRRWWKKRKAKKENS